MEIKYFGHSCFLLRDKNATLLIDPFSPEVGLKLPRIDTDIVTVTHDHYDHNNTGIVQAKMREEPFIIKGPGEYEVSGVSIFGVATYHDNSLGKERGRNTIYIIIMDGIRLAHLGDLGHVLTDEQLEEVNGVDILFIPTGGIYTLDAKEAVEVIGQIEPRVVIPMHYQLPGLKIKLNPVEDFLKEMGLKEIKPLDKLVVSRERLPEEREVVVLNAKS
jgi:L-ascorbate metabolism protein UlaG (beta-lactamase superfamily)